MAARKGKEDKALKVLRELVTQPHNKKCFDCGQRGPTYVNMTIGAFVCTSCSGLLRGLNPPHRIKSISMASFSQLEIEFLQKHGNEVCQNTWLALWESSSMDTDNREEQKIKDHLVHKYERKVWYSDQKPNVIAASEPEPAVKPLKSLIGNNAQVYVTTQAPAVAPVVAPIQNNVQWEATPPPPQVNTSMDLLGNLANTGFSAISTSQVQSSTAPFQSSTGSFQSSTGPFQSSTGAFQSSTGAFQSAGGAFQSSTGPFQQAPPQQEPQQQQQPLFNAFTSSDDSKNHDNSFDLFVNSRPNQQPEIPSVNNTNTNAISGGGGGGGGDKYAALAELDFNMGSQNSTQSVFSGSSNGSNSTMFRRGSGPATTVSSAFQKPNPFMSPATTSSGATVYQEQQQKPINPFQSAPGAAANPGMMGVQNTNMFQQSGIGNPQMGQQAGNPQMGLQAGNSQMGLQASNPQMGLQAGNPQMGLQAGNPQMGVQGVQAGNPQMAMHTPHAGTRMPLNNAVPNQQSAYNWNMAPVATMGMNIGNPMTGTTTNAMPQAQQNSNFQMFGSGPQLRGNQPASNDFVSQGNIPAQMSFPSNNQQKSLFPNPLGVSQNYGNINEQKPFQTAQQPFAGQGNEQSMFPMQPAPQQQTVFTNPQQFPSNTQQYNYPMENSFQQLSSAPNPINPIQNNPSSMSQGQSLFGSSAHAPFSQSMKSTNPFM